MLAVNCILLPLVSGGLCSLNSLFKVRFTTKHRCLVPNFSTKDDIMREPVGEDSVVITAQLVWPVFVLAFCQTYTQSTKNHVGNWFACVTLCVF